MMSKTNNSGVYQLENGNWGYRFTLTENGHRRDIRRIKDNDGNVFTSKTAATRARSLALADYLDGQKKKQIKRKTVREIYQEYREKGSSSKAYTTLRKQDSLWNNHLNAQFGSRYCDELTSAEIKDYLSDLYYKHGFSFRYTEGFLIYLIVDGNDMEFHNYGKTYTGHRQKDGSQVIEWDEEPLLLEYSRLSFTSLVPCSKNDQPDGYELWFNLTYYGEDYSMLAGIDYKIRLR